MGVAPCPNCNQAVQAFKAAETAPSAADVDFFAAAPKASESTATPAATLRTSTQPTQVAKQSSSLPAQTESSYQSPELNQGTILPVVSGAPQLFQKPLPSLFRHYSVATDAQRGTHTSLQPSVSATRHPTEQSGVSVQKAVMSASTQTMRPQVSIATVFQVATSSLQSGVSDTGHMAQSLPHYMAEGAVWSSAAVFSAVPVMTTVDMEVMPVAIAVAPLVVGLPQNMPLVLKNPMVMVGTGMFMLSPMVGLPMKIGFMPNLMQVGSRVTFQTIAVMPGPMMVVAEGHHEERDGLIRQYAGALEKVFRRARRRKVASAVDGSELALEESSESGASDSHSHT